MKGKPIKTRTKITRIKSLELNSPPFCSIPPGKRPRTSSPRTNNCGGGILTVDLSQLCAAASRNDITSVQSCLMDKSYRRIVDFRSSTKCLKSLMPSTNVAKALLSLLFCKDNYKPTGTDSIHFSNREIIKKEYGLAIRSLLLLPPWSVTPWIVASDAISSIQKGTIGGVGRAQIMTILADISMFLNSLGDKKGSIIDSDTYHDQCVRLLSLLHQIIEPMFQPSEVEKYTESEVMSSSDKKNCKLPTRKNVYYDLLLEQLPTILSAGRRLDERAIARKGNVKVKGRDTRNEMRYLEEDGVDTLLYPAMMHSIFSMTYSKNFTGSDQSCTLDLKARQIRSDMISHFITASCNLSQQCHMTSKEWLIVHSQITMALKRCNILEKGILPCDLPVLVQQVFVAIEAMSISTSLSNSVYFIHQKYRTSDTERTNDVNDDLILCSWFRLLLSIYITSSACNIMLGKVKAVLKSTLPNLPSCTTCLFLDFASKENSFPRWVRANMVLLIYESQRKGSRSVYEIISNAVGKDVYSGIDMTHESLTTLLLLPFIDRPLITSTTIYGSHHEKGESLCLGMDNVKFYLRSVIYIQGGIIAKRKDPDSLSETDLGNTFSTFVRLVYESLLLGEVRINRTMGEESGESHSSECAQVWINVAFSLLNSIGQQLNRSYAYYVLIATSVLITIFWEVTSSRISIIRVIEKVLSGNSGGNYTAPDRLELKLNYCLVLSIIVTSANSEKRAGDSQQIHAMDSFMPITKLLTSSNATVEMPSVLMLELVRALSSLTAGREAILVMVRQYSQISYGSRSFWLLHSNHESERHENRLVIEGLVNLIREDRYILSTSNSDSILDDNGLEALCAITNLLVADRPSLPFQDRRLLLQKLLALVEEGAIHQWIQMRLMGAALVAYLPFFRLNSEFSSKQMSLHFSELKFVPQNSLIIWKKYSDNEVNGDNLMTEDLLLLTRLILSLLKSSSGGKRTTKACPTPQAKVNEVDIETLFDVIIPKKRVPMESKASISNKTLHGDILAPLAFSCISAVLNYLVKGDFHRDFKKQKEGNIFPLTLCSCSELQKEIRMAELKEWSNYFQLHQASKRKSGEKRLVPSWVKCFSSAKVDFSNRKYSSHDLTSISLILSSLCSIMSGFLLRSSYRRGSNNKKKDRVQVRKLFRLSRCVITLFDLKRDLVSNKVFDHHSLCDNRLDGTTRNQYYSVINFFNCSREALQVALFGRDKSHCSDMVSVVCSIVPAIMDYCHYIDSSLDDTDRDLHRTLHCLWDFYTIICSENGCLRLIEFLDCHCVSIQGGQLKSFNKKKYQQNLANSITSHDDVDNYVRKLRSSMLSCIHGVFSLFAKSFPQNQNKWKTLNTSNGNDFMFCVQAIHWLSRDLFSGLNGQSSGVTKSMYESYVKMIEEGAKSALEACNFFFAGIIFDTCGHKKVSDVKKMCQATSILLWNTVCNFDVIYPNLFKSSVQSIMWYLPQIVRCIDRLLLPPLLLNRPQLCIENTENDYLVADMIYQCLEALQIELKLIRKQKHTLKQDKLSIEVSEKREENLIDFAPRFNPSTITIPKRCVNVRFPSAKLRNWTFSCSITVAERVWNESRALMIQARETKSKCRKEILQYEGLREMKVTWQSNTKYYASKRRAEVTSILNILNSLFIPMSKEIKGQDISILAELLPQLGKQRLCSCLEMISTTLNHSLRYISRWWKEVHLSDEPMLRENKRNTDIVMAEALACLLAWLSPFESDISLVDFTIGARRWYSLEKKREFVSKSGLDSKPGEDIILGRITKLLLCIEELDLIFNKTYLTLKGENLKENMKNNLLNLDKMVYDVLEAAGTEEEKIERRSFCQIICEHTERIKTMTISVTEMPSGKLRTKTIPKMHGVTSQQSEGIRENKQQSRNCVINNWLELDKEWNEDGERRNDSYLDLEDFLVEG